MSHGGSKCTKDLAQRSNGRMVCRLETEPDRSSTTGPNLSSSIVLSVTLLCPQKEAYIAGLFWARFVEPGHTQEHGTGIL